MDFISKLEVYGNHLREQLELTHSREQAIRAIWHERNDLLGQHTKAGDEKLARLWEVEKQIVKEVLG